MPYPDLVDSPTLCVFFLFSDSRMYFHDDLCLAQLSRAMCLRSMKSPLQAEECLKEILSCASSIQMDKYLVPYALLEYALLQKEEGNYAAASEHLESAKYGRGGESRIALH